jgi:hypothetical protein
MPSDLTVVVADAKRMPSIRAGMRFPGRIVHFNAAGLGSALESIGAHQPKLVVVDALFAQTPAGMAFIDCVEKLAIADSDIRFVIQLEGRWVTAPRHTDAARLPLQPVVATIAPPTVAAPDPAVAAAQLAALSTRRVPRFLVRDPLDAVVENGSASLVDISVLGAQVVSGPVLRPRQKIKLALPDTGDMLRVMALVAWSTYEKPQAVAHYRAGLEFTDAARQALEDYRLRHCAEQPLPYRG